MKFKTSDLKGKSVFLIGPAQNAQVEPHEYGDYDYVARLNMQLSCYDDPPRTDIVFMNKRSCGLFLHPDADWGTQEYDRVHGKPKKERIDKNLNNKIIIVDQLMFIRPMEKKYPSSLAFHFWKHPQLMGRVRGRHPGKFMGAKAMCFLLSWGADVMYGGSDFYYMGMDNIKNYPVGYNFGKPRSFKESFIQKKHKGDVPKHLRYIKDKLMVKFPEQLSMHEKTKRFFKKSLERYNIK